MSSLSQSTYEQFTASGSLPPQGVLTEAQPHMKGPALEEKEIKSLSCSSSPPLCLCLLFSLKRLESSGGSHYNLP